MINREDSELNLGTEETPEKEGVTRRTFMNVMGASAALASLGGCILRRPVAHIVPYHKLPEDTVLGRPRYYASSLNVDGEVQSVMVTNYEGRPTKIDGLKGSPNEGKSNARVQGQVLEFYDPDRSFLPTQDGKKTSLGDFCKRLEAYFQ